MDPVEVIEPGDQGAPDDDHRAHHYRRPTLGGLDSASEKPCPVRADQARRAQELDVLTRLLGR